MQAAAYISAATLPPSRRRSAHGPLRAPTTRTVDQLVRRSRPVPGSTTSQSRLPTISSRERPVTAVVGALAATHKPGGFAPSKQIGRGSCRGRGEISGGAVSFKKKKREYSRSGICNKLRKRLDYVTREELSKKENTGSTQITVERPQMRQFTESIRPCE